MIQDERIVNIKLQKRGEAMESPIPIISNPLGGGLPIVWRWRVR